MNKKQKKGEKMKLNIVLEIEEEVINKLIYILTNLKPEYTKLLDKTTKEALIQEAIKDFTKNEIGDKII